MYMKSTEKSENICTPLETEITGVRLANAYVPIEKRCETYDPLNSLKRGTAFPPLYDDYSRDRKGKVFYEDD